MIVLIPGGVSKPLLTPEPQDRAADLGQVVRARRRRLGLRQEELADLAGCSERFVHALENGKPTVRLDKVLDVLSVLGLDLQVVVRATR